MISFENLNLICRKDGNDFNYSQGIQKTIPKGKEEYFKYGYNAKIYKVSEILSNSIRIDINFKIIESANKNFIRDDYIVI